MPLPVPPLSQPHSQQQYLVPQSPGCSQMPKLSVIKTQAVDLFSVLINYQTLPLLEMVTKSRDFSRTRFHLLIFFFCFNLKLYTYKQTSKLKI